MPKKPKPRTPTRGKSSLHNRNPKGNNQHWGGNVFRISFARLAFDVEGMSYSEVRSALIEKFGVHKGTAERDITEAKRQNAEMTALLMVTKRPELIARQSVILDGIRADATAVQQYTAAIGAVREFNDINGLHIDIVAVGPTNPEQQALVGALMLTPYQREKRIAELKGEPAPLESRADADE